MITDGNWIIPDAVAETLKQFNARLAFRRNTCLVADGCIARELGAADTFAAKMSESLSSSGYQVEYEGFDDQDYVFSLHKKEITMHYRNGREAKNGDKVVKLGDFCGPDGKIVGGQIITFGILHSATPGNDYCNGYIAPIFTDPGACLCDMLHVDDLAAMLAEKGLDKRPAMAK
jgi:hypothetical protein